MRGTILITTSSFDLAACDALTRLAAAGFDILLNPHRRRLSESEARDLVGRDVVAMIAGVEPLTRAVLSAAPRLKVISRCGTGMDSVDLDAAAALGIALRNTPEAPATAVAELTIGLILAVLRRIAEADRGIRARQWSPLMGRLLGQQTLGLVGCGRVGRRVAQLAQAFGARVLAYDPQVTQAPAGVTLAGLDDVIAGADVLSLHLPLTPALRNFLGRERFGQMKRGAVLVNAARGGLVDEAALCEALQSGQLAGAALDCFADEPYDGPLAGLPTVVLTAHMGSYATEARALMEREAADNLLEAMVKQGLTEG